MCLTGIVWDAKDDEENTRKRILRKADLYKKKYLLPGELAFLTGLCKRTIQRMCGDGRLKAMRSGPYQHCRWQIPNKVAMEFMRNVKRERWEKKKMAAKNKWEESKNG